MFFLFRCIFWLGLVFYMMPWASRDEAFADLGGRAALTALIQASSAAGGYCLNAADKCAAVANITAPSAPEPVKKPAKKSAKPSAAVHGKTPASGA